MKRLMAAMALVMVLVSMFFGSAAAAAQTAVTGLKAMPYSATQVKVSWQGDASVYEVYYKPVEGTFHYYDTVYENSAIISVAPDTDYEIIVKAEEGEESEPVYVTTPRISSTREYSYKYKSFSQYFVNADRTLSFWDIESPTKFSRIQGSYLSSAGELRDFFAVADFTMSRTSYDKELPYVIVLYPPKSADRYLSSDVISVTGAWTGIQWAYPINNLFEAYMSYNDAFAKGTYALELYINGWLGGKTTFIVE